MRTTSVGSRLLSALVAVACVMGAAAGAAHGETASAFVPHSAGFRPPNDQYFTELWGLDAAETREGIGVLEAWAVTTGSPGVVVAVIDSGVNRHPDLKRVLPGWDFVGNDSDVTGSDGGCHTGFPSYRGTEVAGIIGAAANNRQGGAGVAPDVSILPIRAFDQCNSVSGGDVDDAILWAAGFDVPTAPRNQYPAKVINVAALSPGACTLQSVIDQVTAAGVIVVAGGGSIYYDSNLVAQTDVWSPGTCDNVITVGGTDNDGERGWSSTFGPEIDVMAPEEALTTSRGQTWGEWKPHRFGTGYAYLGGSAAAAAHVSGVAALAARVDHTVTSAGVLALVTSTARPFPQACGGCGAGLLDAGGVIAGLTPTPGVIRPAAGEGVILGATMRFQLAGVSAKRVFVGLTQGSTTLPLGSVMVERGLGAFLIPSDGFSVGAADLTFTPHGALGDSSVPAPFSVPIELVPPRIEFAGPYSSLALGIRRTVSWATIGATNATGSLVLVKPGGQEVVLRKSVRLAKGSYAFTPTASLGSGTFTFQVRPAAGSSIATGSIAAPVYDLGATGYVV